MSNGNREIRDLLYNDIYPKLNAGAAGFLDHLEPRPRPTGNYDFRCPECNQRRGYYIVGSPFIRCNREGKCDARISIWDVVQQQRGLKNGEVLQLLAEVAGVPLENKTPKNPEYQLARQIREICFKFLSENQQALSYLTSRGLLEHAMETRNLGFYPGRAAVAKALKAANCDLKMAEAWNLIPEYSWKGEHPMANRLVGYWDQPDGSVRLWGRTLGKPAGGAKKYHYSSGLLKTRPYGHRKTAGAQVGVEGPVDRESLELMGVPASAVGGASVIAAQAAFLAADGISRFIHIIDGDEAGWKGGVRSVRELERVGIDSLIAVVPTGSDDVDQMRRDGREQAVLDLIENAMTGGEFLARMMLAQYDVNSESFTGSVADFYRIRADLGPASAVGFDLTLARAGVNMAAPQAHAMRVAANLLDAGLSFPDAQQRVKERFGVNLSGDMK